MQRFNLYKRNGVFYARFRDEKTGKWGIRISTGETSERAALATVYGWERDGIPSRDNRTPDTVIETRRIIDILKTADISVSEAGQIVGVLRDRGLIVSAAVRGPAGEPLVSFLLTFWSWSASPYVKEKRAHGQSITQRRCYDMTRYVEKYWRDRFPDTRLGEITRRDLAAFGIALRDTLAPQTVNHCLRAGTTALKWAHRNGLIPEDPTANLMKFTGTVKRRDILTTDEIRRLFTLEWPDPRARLASFVAMTTGLRASEVAALRLEDIGADRLHVRHSWSEHDGLKTPKNGEIRDVPLLPEIRDQLREHAAGNPWGNSWIFWSTTAEHRPVTIRLFSDGLSNALVLLELPPEDLRDAERAIQKLSHKVDPDPGEIAARDRVGAVRARYRKRGIVFHSWRHFYASRMADRLEARKVMTATGHRSTDIFEVYSNHADAETFREVATATGEAFGNVLQFPGTAAGDPAPDAATIAEAAR